MTLALIGSIIGVVMGLTGAGGALVSLPLFMNYLGMDLKTASVYSLLAVMMASLVNLFFQPGMVRFKIVILMSFASAIGSFVSLPFKADLSDEIIKILLLVVSLFAIMNIWSKNHEIREMSTTVRGELLKAFLSGFGLGILTTLTGLGGGVLLVPIFLRFFHFGQAVAVKNSLLAVGLSAFLSFFIQIKRASLPSFDEGSIFLSMGIVITAFMMKIGLGSVKDQVLNLTRKLVFTSVVIYSMASIF